MPRMATNTFKSKSDSNLRRRLRVFSVDPGLATRIDTRGINEIVIEVPWEARDDFRYGDKKVW